MVELMDRPSDVTRALLKDLLLADHAYFREALWRNEETGERRLQFFVGLVTAVLASVAALATAEKGAFRDRPDRVAAVILGACLLLLVVGVATLGRMQKRDAVTDEYKAALDHVRRCFVDPMQGDDSACTLPSVCDYRPFGAHQTTLRRLGWLTRMVLALNSFIVALAVLDIGYLTSQTPQASLRNAVLSGLLAGFLQYAVLKRHR
jgi:hypothetical protein